MRAEEAQRWRPARPGWSGCLRQNARTICLVLAIAVAGICTDGYSETQALRRELKRAKKNHEAAMISNDALRRQVDELRQSAGSQPKVSTHRDRKLMRLFHPDNYTNAPAEVRTKMVEAYRLVSESRPDA